MTTSYTITLTGGEHSDVIVALRSEAHNRRKLAEGCGDIEGLAKQKAWFQDEAKKLDAIASKLMLAEGSVGP
jgi:hypothetical protein